MVYLERQAECIDSEVTVNFSNGQKCLSFPLVFHHLLLFILHSSLIKRLFLKFIIHFLPSILCMSCSLCLEHPYLYKVLAWGDTVQITHPPWRLACQVSGRLTSSSLPVHLCAKLFLWTYYTNYKYLFWNLFPHPRLWLWGFPFVIFPKSQLVAPCTHPNKFTVCVNLKNKVQKKKKHHKLSLWCI